MAFVKRIVKGEKEWQGESYSKPFNKSSGTVWLPEDTGYHELLDTEGLVVSTGALTQSADNLALIFFVPSSDTVALEGRYRLLIHLTNSSNVELDDVLIEFEIIYSIKKA